MRYAERRVMPNSEKACRAAHSIDLCSLAEMPSEVVAFSNHYGEKEQTPR